MNQSRFKEIIQQVSDLNHEQRVNLRQEIEHCSELKEVCDLLESRIETHRHCPHCRSGDFVKHGFRNNLTRYRCKNCSKTFNALTKTPFARLRKKQNWFDYAKCLLESKTVRAAAATTNVAVATSFRWRHRFMKLAQKNEHQRLSGIVEADETFFLKSQKGERDLKRPPRKRGGKAQRKGSTEELVSVLVACDRSGHEADYITGYGPLSPVWLKDNFKPHLDNQAIVITDSAKSFKVFCSQYRVEHIAVNPSRWQTTNGVYHIQTVICYQSLLKNWLKKFHGVASKYLDHYLGWCHELYKRKFTSPIQVIRFAFERKTPLTGT